MIKVGIVGCGYWGPRLIRNFYELPDADLALVCDLDRSRLQQIKKQYPRLAVSTDFNDVLRDEIEAVVIATPVKTHYGLVKEALSHNKHVLVEKPITASSWEAAELIKLAESLNRKMMVGHIYNYHPAIEYLKRLIQKGELGNIFAIDARRLNLGLVRPDVNVIWDLGPHDISIMLTLIEAEPVSVSARGSGHLDPDLCDLAYLELIFANGATANIQLSWLDPRKVRQVTIIGSKKMAFYDDAAESENIFIYDKGCHYTGCKGNNDAPFRPPQYRYGDIIIPHIDNSEPLRNECQHFLNCIRSGQTPKSDGWAGLKVVQILEAANQSRENGGQRINLSQVKKVAAAV
jgi:predicted dehydrogenase